MSGHTPGLNDAQRSALIAIRQAEAEGDEDASQLRADLAAYEKAMGLPSAYEIESRKSAEHWRAYNALIAAAPDLLKALECVCEHFDGVARDKDWMETERIARAAIARAKGPA